MTIELISDSDNKKNNSSDLLTILNRIDYLNVFPNSQLRKNILHINVENKFPRHRLLKTLQPLFSIKGRFEIRPMMDLPTKENIRLPRGVSFIKKCGHTIIKSPNEVFLKKIIQTHYQNLGGLFILTIPIGDREFSGSSRELILLGEPIPARAISGKSFSVSWNSSGALAGLLDGEIFEDCIIPNKNRIIIKNPYKKYYPQVLDTLLNTSPLINSWKMGTIVSEYKNK
ncbi:hypothetical protein KKD49_07685 [Myxococcota bacterium]|nr:hypothetical protein [Myxococcota bacterium]